MNPQDRELFRSLSGRISQLEMSLAALKIEFKEVTRRAELPEETALVTVPPPLPVMEQVHVVEPPPIPVMPPPIPAFVPEVAPVAEEPVKSALPPLPIMPPEFEAIKKAVANPGGLEFQFGRWLARIGVVLALITLISFSTLAYKHFYHFMGPWSKLTVLALVSSALFAIGSRMERRSKDLLVYGRTLAGGGLACLYYTLYGASHVAQLRVIDNHLLGGLLLLAWSAWVLYLAEKKKSELLSIFAIALAYFSSAITPVDQFTMVANLILAATAVIFLLRNSWTGLSYLCLVGTYAGFLRQILAHGQSSSDWFEFVALPSFWPSAIYLAGAWIIFTGAVFLARTPAFAAGKRMAFLCLNNGAFLGLLLVAANLSGYDHFGGLLCTVGELFLVAWLLVRTVRSGEPDLSNAYLSQGLTVITGGFVIAYTGVTRGLILTIESVFLAAAGAYSRNLIFLIGGGICALFGTLFLIVEIGFDNHYPWTLSLTGTAAMLANAWLARRELWGAPRETANRFVWSSAFYTLLGLVVLLTGIVAQHDDHWIAADLALAALVLVAAVYVIPLFELPLLCQGLLVLAQLIAFVPFDEKNFEPLWTRNVVALITMAFVFWWPRQKLVRTGIWLQPLLLIYALAMVAFGYDAVHPNVTDQTWMISASLLSLAFLAFGLFTRSWQFAMAGQIFLVMSVFTFFDSNSSARYFAWSWWAAAVPVATVYLTAWLLRRWLAQAQIADDAQSIGLAAFTRIYQAVGSALLIRWVFGVVPEDYTTFTLFALGTGVMLWNVVWPSSYGVRTSFVYSLVGVVNYLAADKGPGTVYFTWPDLFGFLLFLAQPALLRRWGRELVTEVESWAVILISAAASWFFVENFVFTVDSTKLTLGWALFALTLIAIGFAANERRQRWCGLAVLAASILRVAFHDFWLITDDLYRVLTLFVLTVICLGLSFIYYKFADRLKEWL